MEWDMIYEIVRTKDYCYIYYGKNAALIIPLKNLKNDNEINCFFQ
ncbi:YcxB family protein [Vallitalea maricola]